MDTALVPNVAFSPPPACAGNHLDFDGRCQPCGGPSPLLLGQPEPGSFPAQPPASCWSAPSAVLISPALTVDHLALTAGQHGCLPKAERVLEPSPLLPQSLHQCYLSLEHLTPGQNTPSACHLGQGLSADFYPTPPGGSSWDSPCSRRRSRTLACVSPP